MEKEKKEREKSKSLFKNLKSTKPLKFDILNFEPKKKKKVHLNNSKM